MDYIDSAGSVFLIREPAPERDRWEDVGYNGTLSFAFMHEGNLVPMVNAVYQGTTIPLFYGPVTSGGEYSRVSEVFTGHGFQIRQAEFLQATNEIITFSTVVPDGDGWGKINGTMPDPRLTQYAIIKYSKDTGKNTGFWDFSERRWSQDFPAVAWTPFPERGNWSALPASAAPIKDTLISHWNGALQDFPDFFDNITGLRNNASLDTTKSTTNPATPSTDAQAISAPSNFNKNSADIITNYNPRTDSPIQIDLGSFSGAAGKLKIAKKTKQVAKLARKDIDFIYDNQKGYLYYNENGNQPGFGDGGILAILEGKPRADATSFEFI